MLVGVQLLLLDCAGSGKTTLLALVTGSSEDVGREARAEGAVLLDGAPLNAALRRKVRLCASFSCQSRVIRCIQIFL